MQRRVALGIAGVVFTVVIPTVIPMAMPQLAAATAWQIIILSAVIGLSAIGVALWPERKRLKSSLAWLSMWRVQSPIARNVALEKALYAGRVVVSDRDLVNSLSLSMSFIGFNGSRSPITVDGITGQIQMTVRGQSPGPVLPPLQFVKLHWTDPVPACSEFAIDAIQRVDQATGKLIADTLMAGGVIDLDCQRIEIRMRHPKSLRSTRLAIWGGVALQIQLAANKISYATLNVTVGARAHVI